MSTDTEPASKHSAKAHPSYPKWVALAYERFSEGRSPDAVRKLLADQGANERVIASVLRQCAIERAMEGLAQGVPPAHLIRSLAVTFGVGFRGARRYVTDARREAQRFFRANQDALRTHVALIYYRVVNDKKANASSKVKAADGLARLWGLNREKPAAGVMVDASSLMRELVEIAEGRAKTQVVGAEAIDAYFQSLPSPEQEAAKADAEAMAIAEELAANPPETPAEFADLDGPPLEELADALDSVEPIEEGP